MSYYNNMGGSRIACDWHRTYDRAAPWLITLNIAPQFASSLLNCFPQSWAVVDDFGTLVVVRGWL